MLSVSRINEVCIPLSNLKYKTLDPGHTLLYVLIQRPKVPLCTVSKANFAERGLYLSGSRCFVIIFLLTY